MSKLFVIFLLSTVASTAYGLSVTTDPLHEGLEDETVTLKCQYTPPSEGGSQYSITWKFTGEYSSSTTQEIIYVHEGSGTSTAYGQFAGRATISGSRGDLRITKVKIEDIGDFVCEVNYYVLTDLGSASTRLEVYAVVERVDIMEYYTGDYVYVKPGQTEEFTCKAYRGRPQARIVWYFDNQEVYGGSENVIDNRDGTYDTTSMYRYNSLREDHNKILKCQSDQTPQIEYRYEYDHIYLNTAAQLTFCQDETPTEGRLVIVTDPLVEGLTDSTVTLQCDYEPPETDNTNSYLIEWTYVPEATEEQEAVFRQDGAGGGEPHGDFIGRAAIVGDRADLQISRLQLSDTGDFRCSVRYYMDDIYGEGETRLEVYKPVDAADIIGHERGAYVPAPPGEPLTLTCVTGTGRPASEIKWYNNEAEILNPYETTFIDNYDGTFNSTSVLTYTSVAMDHGSIIKCESDQTPEVADIFRHDTIVLNTDLSAGSRIYVSVVLLLIGALISVW